MTAGSCRVATSNTTALFRADGGCIDTDNNSDLTTGAPNPPDRTPPVPDPRTQGVGESGLVEGQ